MNSTQRPLLGNTQCPQETDIHASVIPGSEWTQTRPLDRVATGIICLAVSTMKTRYYNLIIQIEGLTVLKYQDCDLRYKAVSFFYATTTLS